MTATKSKLVLFISTFVTGLLLLIVYLVSEMPTPSSHEGIVKITEITKLREINDRVINIRLIAKTLVLAYDKRRDCHLSYFEAYAYATLFEAYSRKYQTDWAVYGALIWVESQYRPTSKSEKNAKGLTQFIETTLAVECSLHGVYYKENETIWNDVVNVAMGCAHLSKYIEKRGVDKALSAYQGGPDHSTTSQYTNVTYPAKINNERRRLTALYDGVVAQYKKNPELLLDLDFFIGDTLNGQEPTNIYVP